MLNQTWVKYLHITKCVISHDKKEHTKVCNVLKSALKMPVLKIYYSDRVQPGE